MSRDSTETDRRDFLKFAGVSAVGSVATLAGCTSGSDGGDGGNSSDGGDGGSDVPEDFPVSIAQGNMPSGLDPHDHRETPTDVVMLHVYEGILSRDADGKVVKNLATDYETVEEGRLRFTIRKDVKFHNGDTLTAEDVVYSIRRIIDENVGFASPQRDQLSGIVSAEIAEDGAAVDAVSEGIHPIGVSQFATYCDIMQKSWVQERSKSEIGKQMNGTGPFKLDNYAPEQKVVLVRNENYWGDLADPSKVTFTAASEASTRVNQLINGERDVVVNVPPQEVSRVRSNDNTRIEATPSTRIIFNALRYDIEPFSNQKFRQALNYAVDLESIVSNVLQGFGDQTGQPTLEGFVGHNSEVEPYGYDPDKAEKLVEESGQAGVEIELHTPVGRYLKDLQIAQAVAGYVDELSNVSASVVQREFGSLVDDLSSGKIKDKPPWYLIGWGEATFDGGLVITALLKSGQTFSSFSDDKIDRMLEQAGQQPADEREATLKELNAYIHDVAPWIFLNRQYSVYGASSRIDWSARRDERIDAYEMSPSQ